MKLKDLPNLLLKKQINFFYIRGSINDTDHIEFSMENNKLFPSQLS